MFDRCKRQFGSLRRQFDGFRRDERAIEGLPIRLVIALVVGVASLSVMMNMITGIQGLAVVEVDVRPSPDVVSPGEETLTLTAVDANGDPVADATVVVKSGTAGLEQVQTATTDTNGEATVRIDSSLGANQEDGTLVVEVKPPAGSEFVDRRANTKILVIRGV
ncbi:Ig domain-containing protein group 1 domain-containing protein [Haloprofundus marisrubri]|uniref:Ig domain-containing protein group 1 domain-containing protein n=1 Tax=Haloprofundus marisrubri TaxID=1514971 RepID=A0A0W1RCS2_9EURY|nr:Ig-like domain-containing protein [Haloprofundus marisrubri]KTG10860.1 Ig domain-containing protein group 1 domain-containing protein [Haloprofundus marisrubri]